MDATIYKKSFSNIYTVLDGSIHSKNDVDFYSYDAWGNGKLEVTLKDIPEECDYDIELYRNKKMKTNPEISLEVLNKILPVLETQEDYSNDALYERLCAFAKENGYKNGQILWPIRTALSGKQMTPAGATEILEVLGKEESVKRLKAAVEKLTQEIK